MALKELVIHCGIPKTGSSSIQRTLMNNYDTLCKAGTLYPIAGREFKKSPAQYAIHQAMRDSILEGSNDSLYSIATNILRESEMKNCDRVLISCEMLSFISSTSAWNAFLDKFEPAEKRFVFYMRERESWLKSWHRQAVKFSFSTLTLAEFKQKTPYVFDRSIDCVSSIAGSGSVDVFSYDEIQSTGNLLDHFVENVLMIDRSLLQISHSENITPGIEQLIQVQRLNRIDDLPRKKRREIIDAIIKPIQQSERDDFG